MCVFSHCNLALVPAFLREVQRLIQCLEHFLYEQANDTVSVRSGDTLCRIFRRGPKPVQWIIRFCCVAPTYVLWRALAEAQDFKTIFRLFCCC